MQSRLDVVLAVAGKYRRVGKKHQIPVHAFAQWDDLRPGFTEADLVVHGGGSTEGEYLFTLDVTDVATGWTEIRAVKNSAQGWVFEALGLIRERLPFPCWASTRIMRARPSPTICSASAPRTT
jgi:hypothetical protein